MYYLDSLKDLKVYSHLQLSTLEKSRNIRNSNLIFFSGNKEADIETFINSGLFNPSLFRGVFVPKYFNTLKLNKRVDINQKSYYDNIKAKCNNIIQFKRALTDYKNANLIYDLTQEFIPNEAEIKVRGKQRIALYLDFLVKRVKEGASYNSKLVAIPVPNEVADETFFDLSGVNTPFGYIYMAIKRKLLTPEQKQALKGINFLFYTTVNNTFIKFTFDSELIDTKFADFIRGFNTLIKIASHQKLDDKDDNPSKDVGTSVDKLQKEVAIEKKTLAIKNKLLGQLNIRPNTKVSEKVVKLTDRIEDEIKKTISSHEGLVDKDENEILDILNNNKELKKDINEVKEIQKSGVDLEEVKRKKVIDKLQTKQDSLNLDSMSIQDIIKDFKSHSIERTSIENTSTLMDETKHSNLKDFDTSYYKKQLKKDLIAVLSSFNNDSDVKLFIHDIKSENTSDDLSKKMTYTVTFQDEKNVRHTVKFDYPIVKEGRFMSLNGGKKLILKQILLLPIVKTKPDTVQVTTNYNKFFVMRFGSKLSQKTEKLKKLFTKGVSEYLVDGKSFKYRLGNAVVINADFETTLEYNEISSFVLDVENSDMKLMFNQSEVKELLDTNSLTNIKKLSSITYDSSKYLAIGYNKVSNKILAVSFIDKHVYELDGKTDSKVFDSISDALIHIIKNDLHEDAFTKLSSFSNAKSLTYNRIKINNKLVPLVVLLGYELGLTTLLSRYNVDYTFEEKNKKLSLDDNRSKIKFKDGYLYYDSSLLRNTLLLDGLSTVATEEYAFEEFNKKDPYIETFFEMFGSRNQGKGFHNTLSLMVDPITLDVLKNLKLPENIYDILLYANTLLEDTSYKKLNDMSSYRIRGAEQINAFLYKILSDSFKTYKDTMKAGNPIKMSVPQDILLKQLLESPTVDEYSVLNPSLEIEKFGAATYKGLAGINLDNAYTKEIRAYDKTMKGIFALSTPDSDKVNYSHSC